MRLSHPTILILLASCKPVQSSSTSQIKEAAPATCAAPQREIAGAPAPAPAMEPQLGTTNPDTVAFQDASSFQGGGNQMQVQSFEEPQTEQTESEMLLTDDGCGGASPRKALTPAEEEQLIRDAYDHATKKVKEQQAGLGYGWIGNVTGCGPKCNEVHDAYQPHVNAYLKDKLQGQQLQHYTPVTVFDSGALPADLSAHVYMGIGTKPKSFNEQPVLKSWIDPWRYGNSTQYKPGTGPNSPDQITPSY